MTPTLTLGVVGLGHPPEPFIDRLLAGMGTTGARIILIGGTAPPQSWLRERGWQWRRPPWRPLRQSIVDDLRSASPGRTARASKAVADIDVFYVPWLNTAVDHPEALLLGRPIVLSCRGSLISIAPWNPDRRAFRDALPRVFDAADAVHCVSGAIREEAVALGLSSAKASVIHPAVDTSRYRLRATSRSAESPLRVIGVGGLTWVKGYEQALVTLANARRAGIDAELTLVGDGPDRERVLYAMHDLGLQDRVFLVGPRKPDQIPALLAEHDVFLHPSCSEGVSNAVLEAMATGLPVVCADVGGMSEVISHRIDGILVPPRDTQAMTAAVAELASSPRLREELGTQARRRIERSHRLDQQVNAFHELFNSVRSARP